MDDGPLYATNKIKKKILKNIQEGLFSIEWPLLKSFLNKGGIHYEKEK